MTKLLLQLQGKLLTPIEADEIRAEGMALKPKICFVMADWPWIELRGLTEKRAGEFLEKLNGRGVRFRVIEKKGRAAADIRRTNRKGTVARTGEACVFRAWLVAVR